MAWPGAGKLSWWGWGKGVHRVRSGAYCQTAKPQTLAKGKFHYEVMSNSSWQDVLLYLPLQFGGRETQLPRKYSQLKAADWTRGRIIDLVLSNIAADTSFSLPIN